MSEEIQRKVTEVVLELLPAVGEGELGLESDVFSMGLDSINAMTLIMNIQSAIGIAFDPADIKFENFRTPASIVALIRLKSGGGST